MTKTKTLFICQECGQRGGKLSAHHIKSFAYILEENKIKKDDMVYVLTGKDKSKTGRVFKVYPLEGRPLWKGSITLKNI